mmetsp:Transcript_15708/g.43480  ORF Transcript_15708/g.43480 Transcript_15708/m.43480 type:complete len:104 (+) Transcript_15708:1221-1532(+)
MDAAELSSDPPEASNFDIRCSCALLRLVDNGCGVPERRRLTTLVGLPITHAVEVDTRSEITIVAAREYSSFMIVCSSHTQTRDESYGFAPNKFFGTDSRKHWS